MAIASVGTLGSGKSEAASTTVVLTTSAAAEAGNLVVLVIAVSNESSTDTQTSEISSIADSAGGNTWTKAGEYCNSDGGPTNGSTVSAWFSRLTNQINSGGTITATLANAKNVKAMSAWEYTVGAAISVTTSSLQVDATDWADLPSLSTSGLASKEHLHVRGVSRDNSFTTFTPTSGFTAFDALGAAFGFTLAVMGEWKISTSTGETSDPAGNSGNVASVFFALDEVSTGSQKRSPSGGVAYGGRSY